MYGDWTPERVAHGVPPCRSGRLRWVAIGWNKPVSQYELYAAQQQAGERDVLVAEVAGRFVGYVTIRWRPTYAPFANMGIPKFRTSTYCRNFADEESAQA